MDQKPYLDISELNVVRNIYQNNFFHKEITKRKLVPSQMCQIVTQRLLGKNKQFKHLKQHKNKMLLK